MSIYCGASFGGGQGYTDTCGKEEYGAGTPLAQCKQCMRLEIFNLKAETYFLRADAERFRWLNRQRSQVWRMLAEMPMNHTDPYIDAAISSPENP